MNQDEVLTPLWCERDAMGRSKVKKSLVFEEDESSVVGSDFPVVGPVVDREKLLLPLPVENPPVKKDCEEKIYEK